MIKPWCSIITWPHGTAIFVQTGDSVYSVHVHNGLALSIDLSIEKAVKIQN